MPNNFKMTVLTPAITQVGVGPIEMGYVVNDKTRGFIAKTNKGYEIGVRTEVLDAATLCHNHWLMNGQKVKA